MVAGLPRASAAYPLFRRCSDVHSGHPAVIGTPGWVKVGSGVQTGSGRAGEVMTVRHL
jgi:hypothetical protein